MFLGTYRLYRTDNAEAPSAGEVTWSPISGDLTSGCTGAAPNGARGCLISAVGVADGGDGVWVGTDDARVSVSPNATTSDTPTWTRVGASVFPNRPVDQIAVDRSNWRIAYIAFGGFGAATPGNSGHVFATTDGGKTFRDATGNLPDVPVNSVVIDPTDTNTIYVGTDVGTFVSTNGGKVYKRLGDGIPKVASWQLDYDATNGVLLNGTHGRGAYTLQNRDASAALVVSKSDSGKPVGPGSTIDYTITVRNIGNATATSVSITDPIPNDTTFVSADNGGKAAGPNVKWTGLTIPAGGQVQVHFTVRISAVVAGVDDGNRRRRPGRQGGRALRHREPAHHADRAGLRRLGRTDRADRRRQGGDLRVLHRGHHQPGLQGRQLHAGDLRHLADNGLRRDVHHATDDDRAGHRRELDDGMCQGRGASRTPRRTSVTTNSSR